MAKLKNVFLSCSEEQLIVMIAYLELSCLWKGGGREFTINPAEVREQTETLCRIGIY